jgi:hypothetical protein
MTQPPDRPKIYHITHVDNLSSIVKEGALVCDREIMTRGGPGKTIGMSAIKKRRIEELEVHCHPGTKVGDYVPFYFCPRSVMLYVLYRGNNLDLTYHGGQGPILHLEADFYETIQWANSHNRLWAFSLSNAGARYCEFHSIMSELHKLDWSAIASIDFRTTEVKEAKQAEFLMHATFPFHLVDRIGVKSVGMYAKAAEALAGSRCKPKIEIMQDWYF